MDGSKVIYVGVTLLSILLSSSDTSDGFSSRRGLPKIGMRAKDKTEG
jgi:hypothetical protein